MQSPKYRTVRQPVFVFQLCHGHPCLVVPGHQLLLVRGDDLAANNDVPLAKEPEESRRSDAEFSSECSGAFASFVALHDITDLFRAESRRQAMDLELGRLRKGNSRALGESQFPQSIRGQGEIRIV